MFRNFYAEKQMADPRDSWYKPNLLYNIHYRPPKQYSPPKMMVVTKKFNPSICTCGEHGCKPHYRMEREVVWQNKEVRSDNGRELREKIHAETDAKAHLEDDTSEEDGYNDDGETGSDEESESDASCEDSVYGVEGIGNGIYDNEAKMCASTLLMSRESGACDFEADIETQMAHYHIKSADAVIDVSELEQRRNSRLKYQIQESLGSFSNGKEVVRKKNGNSKCGHNSNDVRTVGGSLDRLDDITEPDRSDTDIQHPTAESLHPTAESPDRLVVDNDEECGSAFGILSVYCDSELHYAWKKDDGFQSH